MRKLQFLISTFCFCSTFFFCTPIFSQNLEIGLNSGLSFYNGEVEITGKNFFQQTRSNVGVFARVPLPYYLVARGQFNTGQLSGNERKYGTTDYRTQRGLSFNTTFSEVSARLEWHFLQLDDRLYIERQSPLFSTYMFGGTGAMFFNNQTNYSTINPEIAALDRDAQYAKTTPFISVGGGTKVSVTNTFALGLEISGQKTFTDYLDGVSKIANSRSKDYYYFVNLLVSYDFGNRYGSMKNGFTSKRRKHRTGCPSF
jgi:Domain of unknown function (DUF6089)